MNTLSSGYRPFCGRWWKHWLDPQTYYYWLKYKSQRAQRGWADCDVWSLDSYLAEWLPNALRHLKVTKHGTPCAMFTDEELNRQDPEGWTGPDKSAHERAEQAWGHTLTKMIVGFDAWNRMSDGLYEAELGPYPSLHGDLDNLNDPMHRALVKERMERAKPLTERDQKLWEEGMALFTKHFGSLWD